MDSGTILVHGKGRKDRQMILGASALRHMWEYIQARSALRVVTDDLWVTHDGHPMKAKWFYWMLKRKGRKGGVPDIHPHQFRHTFAVWWIKNQGNMRLLEALGGWKRIPETYTRTITAEDAHDFSVAHSHADALNGGSRLTPNRRSRL